MATLTQITADADGTLDTTNMAHDAGTGTPWFSHCNDAPDGVSSDYVELNAGLSDGAYDLWLSLADVDADFSSMDTLNIDIDVEIIGTPSNDTVNLTARIADGDASATWLCSTSPTLGNENDTTRVQRNLVFSNLTGTKAQWNTAHIKLSFGYNRVAGADTYTLRIYGFDIDGTYTAAAASSDQAAGFIHNTGPVQMFRAGRV